MKPLLFAQQQDWKVVHLSLTSGIFRRGIRLFLPPLCSTFIIAFLVRLKLFPASFPALGIPQFRHTHPLYQSSLWAQLSDWSAYVSGHLVNPWVWTPLESASCYGYHLWTITFEFRSSLLLFLAILMLSRCRPLVFLVLNSGLVLFCLSWKKWELALFMSGLLLAKLDLVQPGMVTLPSKNPVRFRQFCSDAAWSIVLLVGLYMASFPDVRGDEGQLYSWALPILPNPPQWKWCGAVLIVWSVGKAGTVRRALESRFVQYLGQISFALYICHEPLLQMIGWRLVPQMWKITGKETSVQYQMGFAMAMLVMTPMVVWVADVFWRLVDVNSVKLYSQ
jgi:peptidoglycan/LPS O-acetylase OafA/YrhL